MWSGLSSITTMHSASRLVGSTQEEILGGQIVEPLEKKPWGLRQFTVEDIDGNRLYFHCD